MREIPERLQDIYEAITRIEKYTQAGRETFDQDAQYPHHMYFGIDRDIVWTVVERDLPRLKSSIEALQAEDK